MHTPKAPMASVAPPLDEALLPPLVSRFYARVRRDPLLGPLFNDTVDDWPRHLEKLADFWSSIMLTSGRYKGNPVMLHRKHARRIDHAMFVRWLAIWQRTTNEMLPPAAASAMQAKARRIADRLMLAITLEAGTKTIDLC